MYIIQYISLKISPSQGYWYSLKWPRLLSPLDKPLKGNVLELLPIKSFRKKQQHYIHYSEVRNELFMLSRNPSYFRGWSKIPRLSWGFKKTCTEKQNPTQLNGDKDFFLYMKSLYQKRSYLLKLYKQYFDLKQNILTNFMTACIYFNMVREIKTVTLFNNNNVIINIVITLFSWFHSKQGFEKRNVILMLPKRQYDLFYILHVNVFFM